MTNGDALVPGTQVRASDGVVGIVEQLDSGPLSGSAAAQYLLVQGADGRRYRLPLSLIGETTREQGHPVVLLQGSMVDLQAYLFADTTQQTASRGALDEWAIAESDTTLRIPVAAEELLVAKRPISWGNVRIHKRVQAEEQIQTVAVYHEEAVIEHISPDQYDATAPTNPDEVIIPIVEEQIVVEKRSVIKEYIRIRKNLVAQQQEVRDTVRREYVEVENQTAEGIAAGSTAARTGAMASEKGATSKA